MPSKEQPLSDKNAVSELLSPVSPPHSSDDTKCGFCSALSGHFVFHAWPGWHSDKVSLNVCGCCKCH